ncbi:glycosyltransferase family 4 protein [Xylanimonas sp. McL0601]|uniref:glycosyltransferase family 4 protein n=1 Tax=Xylanimonas sp. McL0601 TaxID=3414739 RepID=UPI003CF3DC05
MTALDAARHAATATPGIARMSILVCPHEMVRGGSQLNAVDLAAQLRDRGHRVRVYAPAGPVVARVRLLGLDYQEAPGRRGIVDVRGTRSLGRAAREFGADVVHAYEWPPIMQAAFARLGGAARVLTVLSMDVPPFLPRTPILLVGTEELRRGAAQTHRDVRLAEPPVDTDHDQPRDPAASRASLGVAPDHLLVAVVGRLSAEHSKAEGVLEAIRVVEAIADLRPVTLLVAGDGDRGDTVRAAAAAANRRLGRTVVRILGDVADPRPVYDAADITFGMGSSALRALAHGKPIVVQGRDGFWLTLEPGNASRFFETGFFGEGPSGGPGLTESIRLLADDPALRAELGRFGRELAVERYSLTHVADVVEQAHLDARSRHDDPRRGAAERVQTGYRFAKFWFWMTLGRRPGVARLVGRR